MIVGHSPDKQDLQPDILMLTPDRQIDRRILLQADALESVGWAVRIVAMPHDSSGQEDSRVLRIGSESGVAARESRVLGIYKWVRAHLPMNGTLMRWLKQLAWRYVVDQETFYARLFLATVLPYRPKIVVANDLPMLPLARQLAAATGARLVYDSHELYSEQEFSERERRSWARIEARHIGACDAVITVNQSIASELQKRYGIDKVHVILNADRAAGDVVKTDYFHQRFRLAPGSQVLLLQGGLSGGRNLEALVEAMALVKDARVVLVVLGDGLLLKKLQTRAGALAVAGRVHFHPGVPQHALPTLTMAADAGVIPYQAICLNNYLCTPNKLFEFIAAGVPLLANDLPELRRFVAGEQIGLVGEMDSPAKIASLIDAMFADKTRLDAWRRRLLVVRQQICWEVEQKKLLQIYRTLA